MEPEGPLPHSQVPATCPHPEPDRSSPCPYIPLPEDTSWYPPIYAWVSQVVSFPQVSPPKPWLRLLGKWPNWRTILFYVFISILYMFRATSCSSSGESTTSIQYLVFVNLCRWPFRVQVGKFLSDLHTKRSPTHSDIYQMLYWYNLFSWWWARGCSKHVENWNKHIEKNCGSICSFTKNHNKMHGQQNIKSCIHLFENCLNVSSKSANIWILLP